MRFFLTVSSLSLLLLCVSQPTSGQVCTPFSNPSSAPEQPELPQAYEARIEVNYLTGDKRSTSVVHNYDYNRRRASIWTQSNNTNTKLIFDYETEEIHVVTSPANIVPGPAGDITIYVDEECTTYSMKSSPELNYHFGYQQLNETYLLPGTVYEAIRFRNFPVAYNGSEVVKGIPCEVWLSCQYLPELKANFTAKHYFSKPSHGMPHFNSNFTRVPVRAEFTGVRVKPDGSTEQFTEINDFVNFVAGFANYDLMHTPTGVVCKNRKVSRPIPHIEDGYKRFLMSEEQVISTGRADAAQVTYIKNYYYDEEYQAVRFDYRNLKKEEETFWTLDPITVIHDYNVGVAIGINRLHGNCSFKGISNTTFEEDSNYTNTEFNSDNSFIVRLKSGKSLLLLDGDYSYTGRRYIDNIPVVTYISERTLFNQTLAVEYAFTANGFEIGEGIEIARDIPTHLQIYRQDHQDTYGTFYEFATRRRILEAFDASECFESSQKIPFKLDFDFKDKLPAESQVNHEWLIETAYETLIKATNESFTRFSYPRITVTDDGKLHIVTSIVPAPPAIALFTKIPGKWLTFTGIAGSTNVKSAEACAEFCLGKTTCGSFDWNFASGSCYANTKHGSQGTLSQYGNFSHWSRNSIESTGSKQSFKVWETLQKDVEAKNITLRLPVIHKNGSSEIVMLEAYGVSEYQPGATNFDANIALRKYNVKYQQKKFKEPKQKTVPNQKIEDCAQICTNEATFECRSFHFCFTSGECRLNVEFASANDQYVQDECNVYEQDALFHYTQFPLRSTVNSKDKKYKDVKSASECAIKCNNEEKIHCRSFNFCPGTDVCYLSETHLLDSSEGESSGDLVCTHYSRNYMSDFTFVSNEYINLDAELVYKGTTLEECSRTCVVADGFDCKSFDYCAESKTCMLNSGYKPVSSFQNATQGIEMDYCNNYKREYYFVTSSKVNANAYDDKSTGVLTGVSIAFSLLALVAGIVGMQFYIKKKLTV